MGKNMYQEMLNRLNEDQRAVVLHRGGPSLTLSSAGSGKTGTIITRICHLIQEDDMSPNAILAVTFTKKAAEEMSDRLAKVLGKEEAKRVKIGTIHSFARLIYIKTMEAMDPLFERPDLASVKMGEFWPKFMTAAVKADICLFSVDMEPYLSFVSGMKRDLKDINTFAAEQEIIVNGKFTPKTMRKNGKTCYTPDTSMYIFYNMYESWKKTNNYMDFDDMLIYCLQVLTSERSRKYIEPYLSKFEEILVDESQDTSFVSFKIIDELVKSTKNITMVGDTRQLIYGFSGARLSNIHGFIENYNPKIYDLRTNYRSTETIVQNSNKLIRDAVGVLGAPAVANNQSSDSPIDFFINTNEGEEAEMITEKVSQLLSEGVEPNSIAVIYRVHSQAVALEDAMYGRKIPYYSYSKKAFFLRKEIKDILAYLRAIYAPSRVTKPEIERIINKPNRFIPKSAITEIYTVKKENKVSVLSAIELCDSLDAWVSRNLNKFRYDIIQAMDYAQNAAHVGEVIKYILNETGYLNYLKDLIQVTDVEFDPESNFDALITSAKKFTRGEDFLEHIENLTEKEDKDENGNYVRLMTIHMSKGREWEHVFVSGMCDRFYPIYRASDQDQIEEEKRIAYVAVTRPKSQLHISSLMGTYGRFKVSPSIFLNSMSVNIDRAIKEIGLTGRELEKFYGEEENS